MISIRKIGIPHQNFIHLVSFDEILFCQSDNCYTNVFLVEGKKYLLVKSLAKVEKELNQNQFIRINQSYLVNKNYISGIDKREKCIHLTNNLPIHYTISLKRLIALLSGMEAGEIKNPDTHTAVRFI